MSKNKIIKTLKIIALIGPLVFNLIASLIGSLSIGNLLNLEPTNGISDTNISGTYNFVLEDFVSNVNRLCWEPYIGAMVMNSQSDTPIFYMTANVMSEFVFGYAIGDVLDMTIPYGYCLGGSLIAISYYLIIEFAFFIPEVLILFIRWCKNLVYSFTQKGGFDV